MLFAYIQLAQEPTLNLPESIMWQLLLSNITTNTTELSTISDFYQPENENKMVRKTYKENITMRFCHP